jgi:amino acid adenylation domain-containing protein
MQMDAVEDSYPLAPMQQGMLFHSLYAARSGVYVQQLVCVLHEPLEVPLFKRAWQRVVERHPVLRTSFRFEGLDEPLQEVRRRVSVPWKEQDWRGSLAAVQERRFEAYLEADRKIGFQLDRAPLMRLALFRTDDAAYRLVWTAHHALFDGRSIRSLLNEVFAFYDGFCRGRDVKPAPVRPYREYVDWLQKQDFTHAENFWRRKLQGFSVCTPLGVDTLRAGKNEKREGYARQSAVLSEELTSALRSVARRHQITPNTLLMGAWALLLGRYSGEEDVVFGATRAARRSTFEGIDTIAGLFINTLPLRIRVSPGSTLLPWLKEIRAQWIAVRPYQHAPLGKIHEWSDVRAGRPLFESLVVFENYRWKDALRHGYDEVQHREVEMLGRNHYPLTVAGYLGAEIELALSYDTSRLGDAAVARMLGHLQTILAEVVADPERRLSDLNLLTEAERVQLLLDWNGAVSNNAEDLCLHHLCEAQAERTPDAVAVVCEDRELTYRELNRRANRLARRLREIGVGPEIVVGICLERSLEMIVGVLAVLKSGGAYVALDPRHPKERLAHMLAETCMSVLLTTRRLLDRLPEFSGEAICFDRDEMPFDGNEDENPQTHAAPGHLAYVAYTSGSTGTPKGVLACHRGVVNYVSYLEGYRLDASDSVLQLAPLSFDASVRDLIAPLAMGARVVIVNDFEAKDPAALVATIRERGVTCVLSIVPTMLSAILEAADRRRDFESLRLVLVSGETLSAVLCRKAQEAFGPSVRIVNQYGPTEATLTSTFYPVPDADDDRSIVPLGKPIRNARIYILDGHLNAAPIGIAGEIHIGGVGLARGYLKRPELTAEKFVPDPFSEEPGARLYKSGDRARYLPDGNIEFLGRLDHQVKIRGFRVEPGEIEAVLRQHALIREAVVVAREEAAGVRLAAYIVPVASQVPDAAVLRKFLAARLPDHMVPSAFTMLDAVPLSANGKVNRRALPDPDRGRPELENLFVTPRSSVEETLAEIWAGLLRLERIGVHDNFFELGGHSLLATQVIARARDAFRVELPLRALFDAPTVAGIADVIQKVMDSGIEKTAPEISRVSRPSHRVKAPL